MSLAQDVLLGAQTPRVSSVPPYASSSGGEAVELARMAGLILDPWQEFVVTNALGERADGKWAAFEVAVVVSRQNGKGAILEARELAGLFLLDERLVVHSAHQFDTSLEAFRRLLELIEGRDEFTRRVKRVSRSHGEEGIELYGQKGRRRTGGQRVRFRTRTKGGGRGFSGDCVIFDEAMIFPEASHGAILPILSARPNPQAWYTGSAVDQFVHEDGVVLARIRERGHQGGDPSLAYFEWSLDISNPDSVDAATLVDVNAWAQTNPGLGIRILEEHIGNERRSMDPRTFAVERLAAGDWPRTDGLGDIVITPEQWAALADRDSLLADPVCFAFDVNPDRAYASIGAAGLRPDGLPHVELIYRERGTGWVTRRIAELVEKWKPSAVVCDAAGPAASLLPELDQMRISIVTVTAQEHAAACGILFDLVDQDRLRHLGTAGTQAPLAAAVRSAEKRPLGERWAWSRKSTGADISPLVACTLALWGVMGEKKRDAPRVINLHDL